MRKIRARVVRRRKHFNKLTDKAMRPGIGGNANRQPRIIVHPLLRWWMLVRPTAATAELWARQRRMAKLRHPLRYWLQNDLPSWFRVKKRQLGDMKHWVRYRTTERYHIIDTGMKPGYADVDRIMLHANFALLVNYVEVGLAYRNWTFWEDEKRFPKWKKLIPGYMGRVVKKFGGESGLAHLDWEMSDEVRQSSPWQADTAEVVKDLYLWWTVERPARVESYSDPRIWADVPPRPPREDFFDMLGKKEHPARKVAGKHASVTDEFYVAQDQAMLLTLVKIRASLWS